MSEVNTFRTNTFRFELLLGRNVFLTNAADGDNDIVDDVRKAFTLVLLAIRMDSAALETFIFFQKIKNESIRTTTIPYVLCQLQLLALQSIHNH
jgi:hypothetical protein